MILVDRLSFASSLMILRLKRSNEDCKLVKSVHVLDPVKNTFPYLIIKLWMKFFSIKVIEDKFSAGNLLTSNGNNAWQEAQNISEAIDYKTAKQIISESIVLSSLSDKWDTKKVLLYIYKYLYEDHKFGHCTVIKILVANILSKGVESTSHLILRLPHGYNLDDFEGIKENIELSFYPFKEWSIKSTRLSILLLIAYSYLKFLLKINLNRFKDETMLGRTIEPAILLLQEDDLSMDRSFRGQPHWFFTEDNVPKFRTIILGNKKESMKCNKKKLHQNNIYFVTNDTLYSYTSSHPLHKKISNSIKVLLRASLVRTGVPTPLLFELVQFFLRASLLTDFCIKENIKAFMTCENYLRDANVMNMIGPELDVHTISYQYSNMDPVSPTMLSAADSICTFSSLFNERWVKNIFYSNEFLEIGYPYDSSFRLLIDRAKITRKKIMGKECKFIIAYFDETVSTIKYGFSDESDHFQVVISLLKMLNENKNFSVIIKSQFTSYLPSKLYKDNADLNNLIQSGRWLELHKSQYGNNRNIYFPAEAALSSDIAIGHVEGATAGLEAALTGNRCILLNKHNFDGDNVKIFKSADILYDDMKSALNAIYRYHKGGLEYQNLGDWSSIVDQFDSHRDGESAKRLRDFIEGLLLINA